MIPVHPPQVQTTHPSHRGIIFTAENPMSQFSGDGPTDGVHINHHFWPAEIVEKSRPLKTNMALENPHVQ